MIFTIHQCIPDTSRSLFSVQLTKYIHSSPARVTEVLPSDLLCCVQYRAILYHTISRVYNIDISLIYHIYAYISVTVQHHDDVMKWKHFPRYWLFVWGIHWSPVNSPHKGQWRGALMLSLIFSWTNDWANNRNAGDFRRHHAHYAVTVTLSWRK